MTEQSIIKGQKFSFTDAVNYSTDGIVSKKIIQKPSGSVSLFAFDEGQELSEHSAPFDALLQVLEGQAEVIIAGQPFHLKSGESIILPCNIPHAVKATTPFKMLLTMIKEIVVNLGK